MNKECPQHRDLSSHYEFARVMEGNDGSSGRLFTIGGGGGEVYWSVLQTKGVQIVC